MSLVDKLQSATPSQTGMPCGMAKVLEALPEEDREALNKALFVDASSGVRISNTQLYKILLEEGYSVPPFAVAQHRRRQCRCFVGFPARNGKTK